MMCFLKHKSCQLSITIGISASLLGVNGHTESPEDFMSMAESFLIQHTDKGLRNPNIIITPLPSSAKKADCSHQPQVRRSSQNTLGKVTLVISCQTPKWQQYVSAQVDGELAVIAAKIDIPANTPITPAVMTQSWIPANTLRPHYVTKTQDIGERSAKRFIAAGTILADNMLKTTQLIQKGQEVKIIAQQGGIYIEMRGTALEAGEAGKLIKIQNISSGKTLQAKVIDNQSVSVP
jgi:flagella basal body P-ring formation protein FlgA